MYRILFCFFAVLFLTATQTEEDKEFDPSEVIPTYSNDDFPEDAQLSEATLELLNYNVHMADMMGEEDIEDYEDYDEEDYLTFDVEPYAYGKSNITCREGMHILGEHMIHNRLDYDLLDPADWATEVPEDLEDVLLRLINAYVAQHGAIPALP
jgi:hypothetical protein